MRSFLLCVAFGMLAFVLLDNADLIAYHWHHFLFPVQH